MARWGLILTTFGIILGCLACTLDPHHIRWGMFSVGIFFGLAGVVLLRTGERRAQSTEHSDKNLAELETSLQKIVSDLEALNSKKTEINVYDFTGEIDRTFPDTIETFVNGRKRIAFAFGVQSYAEVMTDFAAGERYLNRVWSASVDGYQTEARTFIEKSLEQFKQSLETLRSLKPA